jgi:hypothetical protein
MSDGGFDRSDYWSGANAGRQRIDGCQKRRRRQFSNRHSDCLLRYLAFDFAFFINLKGVPLAAQIVRKVAVQSAIKKLESPIEPGVFNTEINGFTIYVKNVDFEKGTWKNIFIYTEDLQTNETRLITSKTVELILMMKTTNWYWKMRLSLLFPDKQRKMNK